MWFPPQILKQKMWRGPTPEQIEAEVGSILAWRKPPRELTEVHEHNQYWTLKREVVERHRLPIVTSGDLATVHGRIIEWVEKAKAERAAKKADRATLFSTVAAVSSAICAVLAVAFSIWTTRRFVIPLEKPILIIVDTNAKGKLDKEAPELDVTLSASIKNMGKHPADRLRIRVWAAPLEDPNALQETRDVTIADPFYPEVQAALPMSLSVKLGRQGEKTLTMPGAEVFFYVRLDYRDMFPPHAQHNTGFHLRYRIGKGSISAATTEQADQFADVLKQMGAK